MTSQPAVKNNSKEFKLKKFRIGFEVGARGRKDHPLLTLKEDIETKAKNLCKNGNDIRISQAELSKMMETNYGILLKHQTEDILYKMLQQVNILMLVTQWTRTAQMCRLVITMEVTHKYGFVTEDRENI